MDKKSKALLEKAAHAAQALQSFSAEYAGVTTYHGAKGESTLRPRRHGEADEANFARVEHWYVDKALRDGQPMVFRRTCKYRTAQPFGTSGISTVNTTFSGRSARTVVISR